LSTTKTRKARAAKAEKWVGCTIKELPDELQVEAAARAIEINPANRPNTEGLPQSLMSEVMPPQSLSRLVTKYWGAKGVNLTVGFMESTSAELRAKIVKAMNLWNANPKYPTNIKFVESSVDPQVRISRGPGGYWSYMGTDVLSIPKNQPTMNLEGFTLRTPDSEFLRVPPHEAGHTCAFPHEHTRPEIVVKLDRAKTRELFRRTQGWEAGQVDQQILIAMERSSFKGTPEADPSSIMCYGFPGSITTDGLPIPGGAFINESDHKFASEQYPVAGAPPPPPKSGDWYIAWFIGGKEVARWPSK
jgi:hypothetical protein